MSGEGVNNVADIDTLALEATVAAMQITINALQADVTTLLAQTDALGVLTETGGTLTTDGNVQNLYINNAPSGVYKPICVKLDFTNHTAGETVEINVYYRIKAGGNMILQDTDTYAGLVSPELINIDLEPNRFGVQITIQKTVGTNRAYDWEVCYET